MLYNGGKFKCIAQALLVCTLATHNKLCLWAANDPRRKDQVIKMSNRLKTTLAAVNGGTDIALLVGKSQIFPYENGKKAGDTPIGERLNIALQGARLALLSVKFECDPLPNVTDEQIAEACADCIRPVRKPYTNPISKLCMPQINEMRL